MARRRLLNSYFYIEYNGSHYGETVNVSPFDNTGGTATISVVSSKAWTVSSAPAWMTLSVNSGSKGITQIVLTAPNNQTSQTLTGDIVIETVDGRHTGIVSVELNGTTYITVEPASSTISTSGTTSLRAFLHDNGVDTDITSAATWSSSNNSVLDVSGGDVTGHNNNENAVAVIVTASYNGLYGTANVTVGGGVVTYSIQIGNHVNHPTTSYTINSGYSPNVNVFLHKFVNGVLVGLGTGISMVCQYTFSEPDVAEIQTVTPHMELHAIYHEGTYYPVDRTVTMLVEYEGIPYGYLSASCLVIVEKQGLVEERLELAPASKTADYVDSFLFTPSYATYVDGVVSARTNLNNIQLEYSGNGSDVVTLSGYQMSVENLTVTARTLNVWYEYSGMTSNVSNVSILAPATIGYSLDIAPESYSISYSGSTPVTTTWQMWLDDVVYKQVPVNPSLVSWTGDTYATVDANGNIVGTNSTDSAQTADIYGEYSGAVGSVVIDVGRKPVVTHSFTVSASPRTTISYSGHSSTNVTGLYGKYYTLEDGVVVNTEAVGSATTWDIVSGDSYAEIFRFNNDYRLAGTNNTHVNQSVVVRGVYSGYSGTTEITVSRCPVFTYAVIIADATAVEPASFTPATSPMDINFGNIAELKAYYVEYADGNLYSYQDVTNETGIWQFSNQTVAAWSSITDDTLMVENQNPGSSTIVNNLVAVYNGVTSSTLVMNFEREDLPVDYVLSLSASPTTISHSGTSLLFGEILEFDGYDWSLLETLDFTNSQDITISTTGNSNVFSISNGVLAANNTSTTTDEQVDIEVTYDDGSSVYCPITSNIVTVTINHTPLVDTSYIDIVTSGGQTSAETQDNGSVVMYVRYHTVVNGVETSVVNVSGASLTGSVVSGSGILASPEYSYGDTAYEYGFSNPTNYSGLMHFNAEYTDASGVTYLTEDPFKVKVNRQAEYIHYGNVRIANTNSSPAYSAFTLAFDDTMVDLHVFGDKYDNQQYLGTYEITSAATYYVGTFQNSIDYGDDTDFNGWSLNFESQNTSFELDAHNDIGLDPINSQIYASYLGGDTGWLPITIEAVTPADITATLTVSPASTAMSYDEKVDVSVSLSVSYGSLPILDSYDVTTDCSYSSSSQYLVNENGDPDYRYHNVNNTQALVSGAKIGVTYVGDDTFVPSSITLTGESVVSLNSQAIHTLVVTNKGTSTASTIGYHSSSVTLSAWYYTIINGVSDSGISVTSAATWTPINH